MSVDSNDPVPNRPSISAGANQEFLALQEIVSALTPLKEEVRLRLIKTVVTFFGLPISDAAGSIVNQERGVKSYEEKELSPSNASAEKFSENRAPSPKVFLLEKKPQTDVERIACLAYYLTHYREQNTFKTLDLSKLNTEAAQIKFTNPARAVDNASGAHFLVQAGQGKKQISAIGELYVQALPDRNAARQAAAEVRTRRPRSKSKSPKNGVSTDASSKLTDDSEENGSD